MSFGEKGLLTTLWRLLCVFTSKVPLRRGVDKLPKRAISVVAHMRPDRTPVMPQRIAGANGPTTADTSCLYGNSEVRLYGGRFSAHISEALS